MSVLSEINRIKKGVKDAHSAVVEMGGGLECTNPVDSARRY